jgi:hypothetical protein
VIQKRASRNATGRGGKAQTSAKANNLKPIEWYRMDEERIWNAQRTALMSSVPARYTEKERAKHMVAEEERRRTLDGQEATYSGSDIRLNPERKLRITRHVSRRVLLLLIWLTSSYSCQAGGTTWKISSGKGSL